MYKLKPEFEKNDENVKYQLLFFTDFFKSNEKLLAQSGILSQILAHSTGKKLAETEIQFNYTLILCRKLPGYYLHSFHLYYCKSD